MKIRKQTLVAIASGILAFALVPSIALAKEENKGGKGQSQSSSHSNGSSNGKSNTYKFQNTTHSSSSFGNAYSGNGYGNGNSGSQNGSHKYKSQNFYKTQSYGGSGGNGHGNTYKLTTGNGHNFKSGVLGFRNSNGGFRRGRGRFTYNGHSFHRFVVARYHWPHGYHYNRYAVGGYLPSLFWMPDYYVTDYDDYGLDAPPPNFQWVRYGPDLLLIDLSSGMVEQVVYDAFDEEDGPPPDDDDYPPDQ